MEKTILVVDDSAPDRIMLQGFLKNRFTVIEAASGMEMFAVLRENKKTISAIPVLTFFIEFTVRHRLGIPDHVSSMYNIAL